ncbi:MAG: AraC family transcriptional regulator [Thermoleophilia bacterium]
MDALTGLLDGPRARGAFVVRSILAPPWSLRIADEAPLTLMACVRGDAWVLPEDGVEIPVPEGAVAIIVGPDHYTVCDAPGTPVRVVVHPGQRCTTPSGEPLGDVMALGTRTWGDSPDGASVLLTGSYRADREVSRRVLAALPRVLVLEPGEWDHPLLEVLEHEVGRDDPGQEAVLDRLLDLLLIAVLRAWFARPEAEAPAWYRAQSDPVVGRALRAMHDDPARPWTVADLAAEAGISRAALARRFGDLVGEPPMTYLTEWRLGLAADLLREPGATLASVAGAVGYGSPFALSAAFTRVRGITPRQHRLAAASAAG